MAKIWNSKIPGMNVTAQATGASVENVRLVNRGEAELAIVQSDTIDFAFNARRPFQKKFQRRRVLYPEINDRGQADSPSTVSMISRGKGWRRPGERNEANFRQLSDGYGRRMRKAQYLSFSESAEQFKDKHIDAFIVVAGVPNSAIMDIANQRSIRLLTIPDDKAGQLMRKYPFLGPAKVLLLHKGLTAETKTYGHGCLDCQF
jgi:TRAP transporter TAXI family solute receptor